MAVVRVVRIPSSERDGYGLWFFELASRVSALQCDVHGEHAALGSVVGNRAGISGCCDRLLERVTKELDVK